MPRTSKTRIDYGDMAGASSMNKRVPGESSPGASSPARADKPVKATVDVNTVSKNAAMPQTRPTTGGKK